MFYKIQERLRAIEQEERVVIVLAVESGSRAWGFPSQDSDFDVRFLYVRHPEWYGSIDLERRRDVIERPIDDSLDLSGWDLRKALQLFRKSNPPLLEWLQCEIVYQEHPEIAKRIRELLPRFYSPRASHYHYLHMAQRNFREYLRGDVVWRKKYFYVLRPLLAIRWVERDLGPVPIEFQRLVDSTVGDEELAAAIQQLIADKRQGLELGRGPRVPAISDFVESEIERHANDSSEKYRPAPPLEPLNQLFRDSVRIIWGESV